MPALVVEQVVHDYPPIGYANVPGYTERRTRIFHGDEDPDPNEQFQIAQGRRLDPLIQSTGFSDYFVDPALARLLLDENVKGVRLLDVDVFDLAGERLPYKRLIVTEKCGRIKRLNALEPFETPRYACEARPKEEAEVFSAEKTASIFCTDRIAKLIKRAKLKVYVEPVEFIYEDS